MKAADQYHAGIVVDDLDAGMAELTQLFGYEWAQIVEQPTTVRFADGVREIAPRFAYSRSTPRLEIIQALPGTLWQPVAHSGVHHLGYWSDDVPGDGDRLAQAGYTPEAEGLGPDGVPYWAYHGKPGAPRIELVTRRLEPAISQLWASVSA